LFACVELRSDRRYNFVVSGVTVAVIDQRILDALGEFKDQLLRREASPDVFGMLPLVAMMTGGQVEYLNANIKRVFGEQ